jgi:hypothetical protein
MQEVIMRADDRRTQATVEQPLWSSRCGAAAVEQPLWSSRCGAAAPCVGNINRVHPLLTTQAKKVGVGGIA